ncbi:MAG: RHS repeat-associated core domain-containing protein [Bacteroidetes bacterium]|nr:MAG: RHS repeat-associated core domain-containing protein [Bacteroidota bacterium]
MDNNRNKSSSTVSRLFNALFGLIVGFILFGAFSVRAQYPDVIYMKHNMIGDATVVARRSVIHQPGFHVKPGIYYHAYIDPNFQGSGLVYNLPPAPGVQTVTPSDLNYIITTSPQIESYNPTTSYTCAEVNVDIIYFDGLGRQLQDVLVMASPDQKDMITYHTYDNVGRKDKEYMPYESPSGQNGQYDYNAVANQKTFISTLFGPANQNYGFSQSQFEDSPLNRVFKQASPGSVWALNPNNPNLEYVQEFSFETNDANVICWKMENNTLTQVTYQPYQLFVTVKKNENQGSNSNRTISKEYKDKEGKLVMSEVLEGSNRLQTCYIYDELGLLRCVMPPQASSPIDNPNLCYFYNYDGRHRIIEKMFPDAGWQRFVYDVRDRLVMSQRPQMYENIPSQWVLTSFDELNRDVMSGIYTHPNPLSRSQMQDLFDNLGSNHINESITGNYSTDQGYTRELVPAIGGNPDDYNVLTVKYYDNYLFDYDAQRYSFDNNNGIGVNMSDIIAPKNKITGSKLKQLNGKIDLKEWLESAYYYDYKYRVVQTVADNQCLDGTNINSMDINTNKFSFTGRIDIQKTNHTAFSQKVKFEENYKYDHRGRMLEHTFEGLPNQGTIMLASMHYDRLGQLMNKLTHSESSTAGYGPFLQKTDYQYNIRGWLTSINDPDNTTTENDIFAMKLYYNDDMGGISGQKEQFNGNISAIQWKTNRKIDKYCYRYTYDQLNRLIDGTHFFNVSGSWVHNNSFDENNISYFANGNIHTLNRYAANSKEIDNLTYNYFYNNKSNQINYIIDQDGDVPSVIDYQGDNTSTPSYAYDSDGNMYLDRTKGIGQITYNYLDKPEQLDFGNGEKIEYIYDGIGTKLAKEVINGNPLQESSLIYAGNFFYNYTGFLSYILTLEGRIVPDGSDYRFEYFMKDHLGNIRATYAPACPGVPQVSEYNHYYPFGMQLEALCYSSGEDLPNNNLYNGKELQLDYGLQWYDYGARFYDPEIGRFHSVDRYTEKYCSLSPYQYAGNNPILLIDINGDSLAIDKKIFSNKALNEGFEIFANSKEGRAFLSQYAKKGQTLYGHTFTDDGKFDSKGINMAYTAINGRTESGKTEHELTSSGATISVEMNINKAKDASAENIFNIVETYSHESFIHGDLDTKDFLDNGHFDNSNISSEVKTFSQGYDGNYQHYKVFLDFNKNGYHTTNQWPVKGYFVLQQANDILKLNKTPQQIIQKMWNYQGGAVIDPNGIIKEVK